MSEEPRKVVYRGVSMVEGWPERIREAQTVRTCDVRGRELPRVPFGHEPGDYDWGAGHRPCRDCAVVAGELHVEGCDVEHCPGCGGQRLSCHCWDDEDDEDDFEELLWGGALA